MGAMLFNFQPSPSLTLDDSAAGVSPSCFVAWSSSGTSEDTPSLDDPRIHGSAIGCKDGSLFLFRGVHHKQRRNSQPKLMVPERLGETISRSSSPLRHSNLTLRTARSTSPSFNSTLSSIHVSKSRVVSGVSAERVEAPKNYVDFDDEQERLKGMLKGKGVKERVPTDSSTFSVGGTSEKSAAFPTISLPSEKNPLPYKQQSRKEASSSASEASSPRSSLSSLLHPSSDKHGSPVLSLASHIVPQSTALNQAVVAVQVLHDHRYVACLHENGNIELLSTEDGWCLASFTLSAEHCLTHTRVPVIWIWKSLYLTVKGEHQLLFATASPFFTSSTTQIGDSTDGDGEDQTRILALEFKLPCRRTYEKTLFKQIGDWTVAGPAEGTAFHETSDGHLEIIHMTSLGHFLRRPMSVREYPPPGDVEKTKGQSTSSLPIPNPFKALSNRSTDNLLSEGDADHNPDEFERISIGQDADFGAIALSGQIRGIRIASAARGLRGLVWSDNELSVFECSGDFLKNLFSRPVGPLDSVHWKGTTSYTLVFSGHAEEHSLVEVDTGNSAVISKPGSAGVRHIQPRLVGSATLLPSDARTITLGGQILTTRIKKGVRRIELTSIDAPDVTAVSYTIWRGAGRPKQNKGEPPRISFVFPVELEQIILGFSDGHLSRTSLWRVAQPGEELRGESSDIPLSGSIASLHALHETATAKNLVGGGDDGSIGIWSLTTLQLLARWTVFTVPLVAVIQLPEGRLRGCIFCVSQDGTIAAIAADECQFLFLIPASVALLHKVCLGEDNLLLYYGDGRVRLWDLKSREHRRSMNWEKADEMTKNSVWREWELGKVVPLKPISAVAGPSLIPDTATTILVDAEAHLAQFNLNSASNVVKTPMTDSREIASRKANEIRAFLALLLTSGLNSSIDRLCFETLKISSPSAVLGFTPTRGVTTLYPPGNQRSSWCISSDVSAARALAILSFLYAFAQTLDAAGDIDTVVAFYTGSLPEVVGPHYKFPNLSYLARAWLLTTVGVIRQAARALFDSGVAALTDEERGKVVELWKDDLPTTQGGDKDTLRCAMALFTCGSIAVENYSLLSTNYLTEIAKSIAIYLHDESSPYRALAIDLCSRGFPVWQQYVDAVQMLRALFMLATTTRKEAISIQNVGLLARSAILQIAIENTPLFMTTLSMDILNPGSVQHRKSIMQLVVFLIRKKPLVLYSNLPRLVEAVVKSLDPTSSASREAIIDDATEILGHIVQSFPIVDFHMGSQRLAMGTSEGSVIMYDLKTATRLYVLEGHKKRMTACSFSPDGRRLVTVSLDESVVLVWKVGTGFSSFFNPGAPPRQGHGGSEPYKTLPFGVGDDARMSLEASLELVRFEWASDRSVRLKIKDHTLTFTVV